MKCLKYIPVLIAVLALFSACSPGFSGKKQPLLKNGVLDLRGWNFAKDGPVLLKGQWEFYWKQFLKAEDFGGESSPSKTGLIKVPGLWNDFSIQGKKLPGEGFATYRLKIIQDPGQKTLSLHCPEMATAYELYVNGSLHYSNGTVARDRANGSPQWLPGIVSLRSSGETLDVLLHVSNFHHRVGGVLGPLMLGPENQISRSRDYKLALEMFMVGSLIILGLYHLGIFFVRREDRTPLYFGLFCLSIGIRHLMLDEELILNVFPATSWEIFVKVNYATFYLGLPLVISFLERFIPGVFHKRVMQASWIIALLFLLVLLFFPSRVFSHMLPTYQVITGLGIVYMLSVLLLALMRKVDGAGTFLLGFLVMSVTVILDMLGMNQFSPRGEFSAYGFFAFIFSQAYFLSSRSSRAFAAVEELTDGMEAKVLERTRDAEAARSQLEGLSEVSRRVSEAGDLASVLTAVHDALVEQIGPMGVWLLLVDKPRGELYTDSYRSIPGVGYTEEQDRFLMGFRAPLKWESGTLFRTYSKKRTLLMNPVGKLKGRHLDLQIAGALGFRSFVQLPVIVQNEVIGILAISGPALISYKHLPWLKLFADQTAGAVYTASLLARAERDRAEFLELNEFSRKLNAGTDLNKQLDRIGAYVQKNYQIDGFLILRTDFEADALLYLYVMGPAQFHEFANSFRVPLNEQGGVIYRTYLRKKSFYVSSDIIKRDIFRKPYPGMELDRSLLNNFELSSFLLVPLIVQEQVIGMALFTSYGADPRLSRSNIDAIGRFCEQIAGNLYVSSLLENVTEERMAADLARADAVVAVSEVEQLNRLVRRINESIDITAVLDDVFGYFKTAFRIDGSVLYLHEPVQNELYALKYSDALKRFEADERVQDLLRFPLSPDASILYSTFFRRKTFYSKYAQRAKRRRKLLKLDRLFLEVWGVDSLLQVPLVIQNQSIGILCLARLDESMHLNKREIRSIERSCRQIAGAIHSASLFNQDKQRTLELGRANRELEELDQAKTHFFANISHEFRTPLTLILAPVDSLLKGDYGQAISRTNTVFKSLMQNALRLLGLINNLLDFSRIEAGRISVTKEQTNMVELLDYYITSVQPTVDVKGLQITFKNDCESLFASVDRELMEKAIMNLLSNAIKFTGAGGEILIRLGEREQERFALSVQDNGIGIPENKLDTIFERFRQADESSARSFEGSGIGLSLTREIVQLHGGAITVESSPGQGSVFTLLLPKGNLGGDQEDVRTLDDLPEAVIAEPAFSKDVERKADEAGEYSILVVDDNGDMRSFLKDLLEPVYRVYVAVDGRAGLAQAMKLRPELVLSDVMMPEMDGYQMTEKLKRNGNTRDIPVILLSAKAEVADRIEGLQFGADDYLSKPFNSEELMARIRNQIESRKLEKELRREDGAIQKELHQASRIQKNILTPPDLIEQIAELEIEPAFLPMDGLVSGDYYNISPLEKGIASVFVADATGHGTQAALSTMQIDILYRDELKVNSPNRRFENINNKFLSELQSINFFTCFNVDIFADKIRYSSAGHPGQYLIRTADKEIFPLGTPGGIIGMLKDQTYGIKETPVESGDILLLFTDGIFEVYNSELEEFGEDGFLTLIQDELHRGLFKLSMKEITASLMGSIADFKHAEPFWDDITLIGIRLK